MTALLAVASLWKCEHVNTQASISCHGHMPTRVAPNRMLLYDSRTEPNTTVPSTGLAESACTTACPFFSYPWILMLISQAIAPTTSGHEL